MHRYLILIHFSFFLKWVLGDDLDFTSPVGVDTDYKNPPGDQKPLRPIVPNIYITKDEDGNVLLQLPQPYRDSLQDAVKKAAETCGGKARLKKRDLMGCMINQAEAYAEDNSVFRVLDAREMYKFRLRIRRGQQRLLDLSERFKNMVDLNRALLFLSAAFETQTVGWAAGGTLVVAGAAISLENWVKFEPVDKEGDRDEFPTYATSVEPLPTQTSVSCKPTATDGFPTNCADDDCQGEIIKQCRKGPEQGCPCTMYGRAYNDPYDTEFGDLQQELLKKSQADAPVDCSFGTLGEYEGGGPVMKPSAWCVCTSASTTAYYATRTATGDGACAYTEMPDKTISPSKNEPPGAIDTAAPGWPTEEPQCLSSSSDSDDEDDRLLEVCNLQAEDFANLCAEKLRPSVKAMCRIPPSLLDPHEHDYDNFHPALKNDYLVYFDRAKNAPRECEALFTSDAKNEHIDSHCVPALQAIKAKCPRVGGKAKNACGTFVYQACKRKSDTEPGECHPERLRVRAWEHE